MSISAYREINRTPTASDQWKLAAMFLVGFGAMAGYQAFVRHESHAATVIAIVAVILAIAALVPGLGRYVYIAWMGLGVTIGLVTQPVILLLAFLLFFVPIALFFRITGRDLMKRKLDRELPTYWEDYSESDDAASYFKQH